MLFIYLLSCELLILTSNIPTLSSYILEPILDRSVGSLVNSPICSLSCKVALILFLSGHFFVSEIYNTACEYILSIYALIGFALYIGLIGQNIEDRLSPVIMSKHKLNNLYAKLLQFRTRVDSILHILLLSSIEFNKHNLWIYYHKVQLQGEFKYS